MKHMKIAFFIILLFLFLLISGCLQQQKNYNLSEAQIKQFLGERGLTPVAVRNFENYTIILTKNQICSVSVDKNGKMFSACWSANMNESEPVSINEGIAVTIHDDELLKKAYMVSVIFENKDEVREPVNNASSIIIIDENQTNNNGWYSIKIYDKNNSVLFNKTIGYTTIKHAPEITLFEIPGEIRETFSIGYYYYYPPYSPKKDLVFQTGEPVILWQYSENLRKGNFSRIPDKINFVISDVNRTIIWNESVNFSGEGSCSSLPCGKSGVGVIWNQTNINNSTIKPGIYKAGVIFNNLSYNAPADYSSVITFRIEQ